MLRDMCGICHPCDHHPAPITAMFALRRVAGAVLPDGAGMVDGCEAEGAASAKSPMCQKIGEVMYVMYVMTHLRNNSLRTWKPNREFGYSIGLISSLQKIHPAAARWHTPHSSTPFHRCAFQGYCRKRCCIRSFCLGPTVPLFSSTKAYKQHIHFLPQSQSQSQGAQS